MYVIALETYALLMHLLPVDMHAMMIHSTHVKLIAVTGMLVHYSKYQVGRVHVRYGNTVQEVEALWLEQHPPLVSSQHLSCLVHLALHSPINNIHHHLHQHQDRVLLSVARYSRREHRYVITCGHVID
jgi:hypothetical protein